MYLFSNDVLLHQKMNKICVLKMFNLKNNSVVKIILIRKTNFSTCMACEIKLIEIFISIKYTIKKKQTKNIQFYIRDRVYELA